MPENHAVKMDNFFPSTDKVTLRRGFASHATGMTGDIESLIEYIPLSGNGQLFAANNGSIYNVTSPGAIGAAVSSGHTSNRWQYTSLGNAAGQFVRLVNGVDTPLLYDGTTWGTSPSITGPTAANLVWINNHQRRLWFGENSSLSAWYLPVNAIGGAATLRTFGLVSCALLRGSKVPQVVYPELLGEVRGLEIWIEFLE